MSTLNLLGTTTTEWTAISISGLALLASLFFSIKAWLGATNATKVADNSNEIAAYANGYAKRSVEIAEKSEEREHSLQKAHAFKLFLETRDAAMNRYLSYQSDFAYLAGYGAKSVSNFANIEATHKFNQKHFESMLEVAYVEVEYESVTAEDLVSYSALISSCDLKAALCRDLIAETVMGLKEGAQRAKQESRQQRKKVMDTVLSLSRKKS